MNLSDSHCADAVIVQPDAELDSVAIAFQVVAHPVKVRTEDDLARAGGTVEGRDAVGERPGHVERDLYAARTRRMAWMDADRSRLSIFSVHQ